MGLGETFQGSQTVEPEGHVGISGSPGVRRRRAERQVLQRCRRAWFRNGPSVRGNWADSMDQDRAMANQWIRNAVEDVASRFEQQWAQIIKDRAVAEQAEIDTVMGRLEK